MIGDYLPGALLAVIDRHGVAMLPAATGDDVLAAVRRALGPADVTGGRVAAVLEALTFGTRMSDLAPFAVAVVGEGGVDLLVRGEFTVVAEGSAGDAVPLTGAHVTSWREQWVPDASSVQITAGADLAGTGRRLPLERGVVLAVAVRAVVPDQADDGPDESAAWRPAVPVTVEPLPSAVADPEPQAPDLAEPPADRAGQPPVEPVAPPLVAEPVAAIPVALPVPAVPVEPVPVEPVPVDPVPASPVPETEAPAAGSGQTTLYGDVTMDEPPALVTGVPAASQPDEEGATDFGYLWHTTIDQGVEHAAVRGGAEEPAAAAVPSGTPAPPELGDHDGETVYLADILGGGPAVEEPPVSAPVTGGVLSRFCPSGHQNPPHAAICSVCAQPLTAEPRVGPRPTLGRLRLGTGEVVALDRSVILGRRPQASRVSAGEVPQLVSVGGKEISRSHLELRIEDWTVLAADLGSRNGTLLLRPGQPPVRLVEPTPVRAGDRFDLGEGVVLTAEDVP